MSKKLSEILEIIEGGESLTVEFKQQFTEYDKIAKEMLAFANTKGGVLIFGVRDNRKILGVHSEKEIAELVEETARRYCNPPVDYEISFFEHKRKLLAVVEIAESKNKPHRLEDYKRKIDLNTAQVYVRVNDKSVLAGKELIKIMLLRADESPLKNYSVGKNERIAFEYLENNDFITAKILSEIANISNRRASRTLINLVRAGLLYIHTKDNGENYFTNAGV
jgi:predicted HTH transcriptional regulator